MTLGNLVALTQDNIKRMLAYSSIAHTGYILVGLAAFGAAPARLAGGGSRPPGRALLQRRVRVHEPGRVRLSSPRCSARPGVTQPDLDLRRAGPARAAARRC